MKTYKETINKRICLLTCLLLLAMALGIYDTFFASEQIKSSPMFNFQLGLTAALAVMAAANAIKYKRILTDEQKLKKQYYKVNDERMKAIKAGLPAVLVYSVLMIVAGIIAGYFNELVFMTLGLAAVIQMVLAGAVKFIYQKFM